MRRNFFTIVIAIILLYNMLSACSSQRKDQDNKLSLEYQATYTELSSVYDSLLFLSLSLSNKLNSLLTLKLL